MFKKLIEKLYFKCYPDRKDAHLHSLETIECRVVNYPIKTIHAEMVVDTFMMDHIPGDLIKKELARKLSSEIMKHMIIEEYVFNDPTKIGYRATVHIADRRM